MDQIVSVTLSSDIVYVTGTVNNVTVTWTRTDTTTWQAVCARAEENTYVVYIEAIDSLGNTTSKTFTLYYGLNLIYDRTQADVRNGTDKGYYNATDLNRVEGAVSYLCSLLQSTPEDLQDYAEGIGVAWDSIFDVPYDPEDYSLTVKLDWAAEDLPTVTDMARYLGNVEMLTEAITAAYPTLPSSMTRMDYAGANAIERALIVLYDALTAEAERITALLDNTAEAFVYSGQPYSGMIWTQLS